MLVLSVHRLDLLSHICKVMKLVEISEDFYYLLISNGLIYKFTDFEP